MLESEPSAADTVAVHAEKIGGHDAGRPGNNRCLLKVIICPHCPLPLGSGVGAFIRLRESGSLFTLSADISRRARSTAWPIYLVARGPELLFVDGLIVLLVVFQV